LSYQFDRPFIVDSTAYSSTFGEEPKPADQALAATVACGSAGLPATRTPADVPATTRLAEISLTAIGFTALLSA
jgi:hypothetical protein